MGGPAPAINQSSSLHCSRLKTQQEQGEAQTPSSRAGAGACLLPHRLLPGPWPQPHLPRPVRAGACSRASPLSAAQPGCSGTAARRFRVAYAEGTGVPCPLTNWAKCRAVGPGAPAHRLVPGPQAPQRLASCTELPGQAWPWRLHAAQLARSRPSADLATPLPLYRHSVQEQQRTRTWP